MGYCCCTFVYICEHPPFNHLVSLICFPGLDKIEAQQQNPTEEIYKLAFEIIEQYFSDVSLV